MHASRKTYHTTPLTRYVNQCHEHAGLCTGLKLLISTVRDEERCDGVVEPGRQYINTFQEN